MTLIADLKALSKPQRAAIWASYLGWTLDAFDFFLMVFMLSAIATEFGTDIKAVSVAIFLTLAARPFGALFFGLLADKFGRRPILMIDVTLFSLFSFASAFAPSLVALLILRTLFGFAMGGEWGIGASLVMETIPAKLRGPVSGLLQSGYPSGYFLASLVYFLLFDLIGWRGMFMVGIAPAILVLLIRMHVEESPAFEASRGKPRVNAFAELARHWKIALYMIVLMAAFNAFSHGTQDLYPTFLQQQHHFDTRLTGTLTAIMNVGAIVGGIGFGIWSETIGRRRAIIYACLLALPVLPLWAFTATPLLLGAGAFLMQVAVQGAWGIVPVHLNELSPGAVRAMFPGVAYQLGNLIMSRNAVFQADIADSHGGDYGLALALFGGAMAVLIAVWTAFGPERTDVDFTAEAAREG
ncbi:SHS family lactate transporter-like MFS transporter [Hephaestia caeni]|uniref:SHS family lactate transporter-like MFS transporter n=1 Tax=Hephaestia caeni TaxID=645617 RepID=A0A397PC34_9SPHN|nr:MFS transporter [Hephaestia caeni]RIA47130.1 SHS family lactate transporter-like MFS transporter [Hephaestia caeni]